MSLIIASVDPSGNTIQNSGPGGALSSTGRYVTFSSYLRDTCVGVTSGCVPVTIPYTTSLPQFGIYGTGVSTDGRYVSAIESPYMGGFLPDLYDACGSAPNGCVPAMSRLPGIPSSYLIYVFLHDTERSIHLPWFG